MLDEKVWIECSDGVARDRLIERHLQTGIEPSRQEAANRGKLSKHKLASVSRNVLSESAPVNESDMLNGRFIREHLVKPTFTIQSVLDFEYVKNVETKLQEGHIAAAAK